ncbi:MAG: Arc family DNA-binding protein [Bacteroidales bacterium]|nr:Arc family DNA-binding protein [Bacteroidales bacterium]MDD6750593.1 Arc family DNA-binding protein [Bacteroidales bacterium]
MNTGVSTNKKQTAFRFSEDLLERLKERAKKDNRSLNNYVEKILMEAVYDEPNEETIAAMKEAKEGKSLETLDLAKFKEFVASL